MWKRGAPLRSLPTSLTPPPRRVDIRQLFERHYAGLVRFLQARLGDRDRAEDLAQEAFVRLVDQQPRDPGPWLFVVGANLARDEMRRETRRSRRLALLSSDEPRDVTPERDLVVEAEHAAQVRATLERLSERDRTLLVLRAEGYSYREVAAALGVAVTSVAPLLGRAQRRFARDFVRDVVRDVAAPPVADRRARASD